MNEYDEETGFFLGGDEEPKETLENDQEASQVTNVDNSEINNKTKPEFTFETNGEPEETVVSGQDDPQIANDTNDYETDSSSLSKEEPKETLEIRKDTPQNEYKNTSGTQYDDETGIILSSEDEIYKDAQGKDSHQEDSLNDSELESEKKPAKLDKKLINLAGFFLVALLVVGSMFVPKKTNKNEKEQTAASITPPEFSNTPVYVKEKPEQVEEVVKTPEPAYIIPKEPAKTQPTATQAPVSVPIDTSANNSPLIPQVQGRILGQNISNQNQNQNQGSVNSLLSSLTQEDYINSRLNALGVNSLGSTGSNYAQQNSQTQQTSYQTQNMQDNKQAFYSNGKTSSIEGSYIDNNTIWNGSIIPAVLITGINTDLPGEIQARVTENIYDSLTGKKLLIPQGTIIIASYNSSISFAQSRVQIAWNTLIRPDGYHLSLGNMNGVDTQGLSGTKGQINDHLFQYVKAAGIISAFTILNGEFNASIAGTQNPSLQNLMAANQGVVNQLGANVIDRTLNVQPTITVKSGTKINIMLNNNIVLPPMQDNPVKNIYVRQ